MTTPDAACGRLPLEGATLADRRSRIRGVCLQGVAHCAGSARMTKWSQ